MISEEDLKQNEEAAALILANPKDWPAMMWDAANAIQQLCQSVRESQKSVADMRDQLHDCETSLDIFDDGRTSEYWMRHCVQPSNE